MYIISDTTIKSNVETALQADTREFRQRVTFGHWTLSGTVRTFVSDDVEIESGITSLHISQKSNGDSGGLLMGCCCSSCAEAEFYNPDKNYNYSGKVMFVESGIKLSDGSFYYIPLGYYNVEAPESDDDWYTVRIKAYDDVYQMTSKWTTTLTYPATLLSVLTELAGRYNLSLYFPVASYRTLATSKKITAEQANILANYADREVLGFLAGMLGFNARMNTVGKLNVSWYYQYATVNISASLQWQNGFKKTFESAFTVSSITSGINDAVFTSGTGKGITFSNPIITQTEVTAIYNRFKSKVFQPCQCEWRGNPCVEAGDIVTVTDKNGNTYTVFVAEQEIDLTGGLSMSITCPPGDADISFDTLDWETRLELNKQKNELQQAIETATNAINGAKGGYYEILDTDSDGNPDGWIIKENEGGTGGIIRANKEGIGLSQDGGKTYKTAITYKGIAAEAIICADLKAIGATIGGWNIGEDAIYKDVGDYRAYIQSPYTVGDETWVFSTQVKENGEYRGTFYVTIKGDMHVQRIDSDKTIYTNCAEDDSIYGAIEHRRGGYYGAFGVSKDADGNWYGASIQCRDSNRITSRLDVREGEVDGLVILETYQEGTDNKNYRSYLSFGNGYLCAGEVKSGSVNLLNFQAKNGYFQTIDCQTIKTAGTGFAAIEHTRGSYMGSLGVGTAHDGEPSAALQLRNSSTVLARLDVCDTAYTGCVMLQTTANGDYSYLTFFPDVIVAGKADNYADTSAMLNFKANEIFATKVYQSSTESIKTNITAADSALGLFEPENSQIYSYNLKKTVTTPVEGGGDGDVSLDGEGFEITEEVEETTSYGFVIGDGYAVPEQVLNKDGNAINLYSMAALTWKAVQELHTKIKSLEEKVNAQ